jgi:hypothetical protein
MPAWNFLPSTISLKRKRADSPDVEEPPAKRHTASKLVVSYGLYGAKQFH